MPHKKERKCSFCFKVFKRHQHLTDHIKDYHSKGPKTHYCSMKNCFYSTNRLGNFNLHLMKTHKLNLKTLTCPKPSCKFKTKREESLIKHIRKFKCVKNLKTIKCDECDAQVLTIEGLEIHKKLCHNEEKHSYKNLMLLEDLICL